MIARVSSTPSGSSSTIKEVASIQHAAETQKQNKVMALAIMEQIDDIQMEIDRNNEKLLTLLESTPKKSNTAPESAYDSWLS